MMDGQMDRYMDGLQIDGWFMDRWMVYGWTDGWLMNGCDLAPEVLYK